mgnify:CR=1 FL=1
MARTLTTMEAEGWIERRTVDRVQGLYLTDRARDVLPQALAAGAPDYTSISGDLDVTAPDRDREPFRSTALVAFQPVDQAPTAIGGALAVGGSSWS